MALLNKIYHLNIKSMNIFLKLPIKTILKLNNGGYYEKIIYFSP